MLQIFKYQIKVQDVVEIEMPQGASVLTVQAQYGVPCIWAIVDPEQPLETRHFRIFGTGQPIEIESALNCYINTFQLLDGQFIGHLFELRIPIRISR